MSWIIIVTWSLIVDKLWISIVSSSPLPWLFTVNCTRKQVVWAVIKDATRYVSTFNKEKKTHPNYACLGIELAIRPNLVQSKLINNLYPYSDVDLAWPFGTQRCVMLECDSESSDNLYISLRQWKERSISRFSTLYGSLCINAVCLFLSAGYEKLTILRKCFDFWYQRIPVSSKLLD